MIVNCPHCGKQMKLGGKIQSSIEALAPGQQLRIKCIQCAQPIGIDASMAGQSAPVSEPKVAVRPPEPPDISWLKEEDFKETETVEEVPRALVRMADLPERATVVADLERLGYKVEVAESTEDGMTRMQFVNYASVVLHLQFEKSGLEGTFHRFMMAMNMAKRRYIFYVLIGSEFSTMYNLQALACSANLVVNDRDIPRFSLLLRKTIPEYEMLFGPLMEELRLAGR
jgi:hypothetical protein